MEVYRKLVLIVAELLKLAKWEGGALEIKKGYVTGHKTLTSKVILHNLGN